MADIAALIHARINDGRRVSDGDALDAAREIDRLRNLLGRYADHVGQEEGTDFLDRVWSGSPITEAEAAEISGYLPKRPNGDDMRE